MTTPRWSLRKLASAGATRVRPSPPRPRPSTFRPSMGRRVTDRETVADIQESIDCLTQRKMLPKREGGKSPRVGDIPGKVFKA